MRKSHKSARRKRTKNAPSPKKPQQLQAPILEGPLPENMRGSFCGFVRHMLQGTTIWLTVSKNLNKEALITFTSILGRLRWDTSNSQAKEAVEDALSFLTNLRDSHKKEGDAPFYDSEEKRRFFSCINLSLLYLGKVHSIITGGPQVSIREDMSLGRIIGDAAPLIEVGFGPERGKCLQNPEKNPRPFEVVDDVPRELDMLNIDRIDVFLLIENLLSNAKRARATKVTITAKKSRSNSQMAEISVKDNGIGFTPRQLKKANSGQDFSTKKKSRGEIHGVGLAHCRFISAQHGGTFKIDSKRGEGTTILFTLPFAQQK